MAGCLVRSRRLEAEMARGLTPGSGFPKGVEIEKVGNHALAAQRTGAGESVKRLSSGSDFG